MVIEDYLKRLDAHTHSTLRFVEGIPNDYLSIKFDNKWGILEILEHIYLTEKLVLFIVSRATENSSNEAELVGDKKLERVILGLRNKKIDAPDRLKPRGELKNIDEFKDWFLSNRTSLKDGIVSGKIVIDNRIQKHPVFGDMTITDWLNFILHHTQRHLEQINDIQKV
jgi:hypothetical protein